MGHRFVWQDTRPIARALRQLWWSLAMVVDPAKNLASWTPSLQANYCTPTLHQTIRPCLTFTHHQQTKKKRVSTSVEIRTRRWWWLFMVYQISLQISVKTRYCSYLVIFLCKNYVIHRQVIFVRVSLRSIALCVSQCANLMHDNYTDHTGTE